MDRSDNRRYLLSAMMALIGASFFLLLFNDWWLEGFGWWIDGFALWMAGMMVGIYAGYLAAPHLPVAKGSDVPHVFIPMIFQGIAAAIWLCLPQDMVAILGFIAKAFDGGMLGYMLVEMARFAEENARVNRADQPPAAPPDSN
jgi:hypothetical protein